MNDFDLPLDSTATEQDILSRSKKPDLSEDDVNHQELEEGMLPAILGYVPFLFFVPLFGARGNSFAIRHGKQALALFIIEIVALSFLIDVVSELFWTIVFVACLGLALVACVHAAQGKFWDIPYLGEFIKKYVHIGGNRE